MTAGLQRMVDLLPWKLAQRVRRYFPPQLGFCFVLNEEPPIILLPEDFYDDPGAPWPTLFQAIGGREVTFVCLVRWGLEGDPAYRDRLLRILAEHHSRYPRHRFAYLANNSAQLEIFRELGLRTAHVNQNALVDERPFVVMDDVSKKYDAVYNAVMAPFKRHELAANVSALALITYFTEGSDSYFERISASLSDATWLNFRTHPPKRAAYRMIPQTELARRLNEARVGLCLSESEGAMFAAVEYLLCGLSIVSTPSIGGRDAFFDPRYVDIVEPDARAVSEGVQRMCERVVPPAHVRAATMQKIWEHRERLLNLLQQLAAEAGGQFDREQARGRIFPNQIYKLRELHRVAALIGRRNQRHV